uniref:non-specific serine/threonine protein kinase n=1 Tax=Pygocentrus nattereri TaxID=42514 RepID=A0A3B4DJD1_PYGNA
MANGEGSSSDMAAAALQQCQLLQNIIDISICSLKGLRTKCTASCHLTQQEIQTLEVKLLKYITKQLQCKQRVPVCERSLALDSYPHLVDWLHTINLRPELIQAVPVKLSLEGMLQMSGAQVQETMRKLGSSTEECSRITAALSCLKSATDSSQSHSSCAAAGTEPPLTSSGSCAPRSVSVSTVPSLDYPNLYFCDGLADPFHPSPQMDRRTLGLASTPPLTPPTNRIALLKPPRTPPPPSNRLRQLLPTLALPRSKSHTQLANRVDELAPTLPKNSPQTIRRDFGLTFSHRFSTKSWLSQTCEVCKKNLMFGVKCKHCKLKCHNRCTKEAPHCKLPFPVTPIRRTESVPSDINNRVDQKQLSSKSETLPNPINKKDQPPSVSQLDSSSNPSSTTSSTPSSPAFSQSNPPSATPPPNPSPKCLPYPLEDAAYDDEGEGEDDDLDDLPNSRSPWKGPISRKHSQTSVYLQEWDVPFWQLELGELIGKGRWGKVHRGRWHGEVAVRVLEIDGNNQDHLKLFKKEVMNYRQTRHENVVLFMGACMNPPQLAIITSFCKGRTLYSVVRDSKTSLDINKTRQIAQEIVKGMGYLHAKEIVHKDLKSKNVFYDANKVVITDFGLFGMSGVVQEDRRENELKLPRGWIYYLAPEIVQRMCPGNDEDRLPFSKAADVYAFGTIWYELQARDWPLTNQPAEAAIWQLGSGEGIKRQLSQISVGKEVTEILSACWSFELEERPTFSQLADHLEKLPKLNRRLSHPGHFWKSAEYVS